MSVLSACCSQISQHLRGEWLRMKDLPDLLVFLEELVSLQEVLVLQLLFEELVSLVQALLLQVPESSLSIWQTTAHSACKHACSKSCSGKDALVWVHLYLGAESVFWWDTDAPSRRFPACFERWCSSESSPDNLSDLPGTSLPAQRRVRNKNTQTFEQFSFCAALSLLYTQL